ncbi:transcriptional regulator, GntR family [Verrucomicrobium sp. GAS474]|uniref:GntR family transcriptional regulator n=1 Tax=Verrucomicrobium sp. GAS474 TaxID=1882831 RepID=UPI0008799409|nr:GntR family transcriptional regulator [Verrucomicrobium sp. GAS474]SDT94964.1 transcriptional regulator, GntR family [Verrucomicrobium sp. GAS474]
MNLKPEGAEFEFETQAVRLFRNLEFEILSGKLPPGTRLVRRELTQRFHLSQATVSEALWRLETDGLAESAPMYGTRVTRVTPQRLTDESILREALECQVARIVSRKIKASDLPRLEALADRVDALLRKAGTYSRADMEVHQEFHLAVARLSESRLLIREVERLWRRHFMFFTWVSGKLWPSPAHWHRKLLDALMSGDPDKAERTTRDHVRYGAKHQQELLDKAAAIEVVDKRDRRPARKA